MKKTLLIALLAITTMANAQYTKLLDFAGATNGSNPSFTNLIQASDGMLYGMTAGGGANNYGVIFQYDPVTSTYTKKFDFDGNTNGADPHGSLIQASDGMLYGMLGGGAYGYGVLFQYNPVTSTYTKKFDFTGTGQDGIDPYGSLMQASDGMLYGMTEKGGVNNDGVLFQYNPSTSTYTKKLDFNSTNGEFPTGSLMQASDGMLYGMTEQGGANSDGVLFQYNPSTNTYTKKLDFTGTGNGSDPAGSLMQASDGMLYGMTMEGGVNNLGVLFQYNPSTSTYTKKLDFNYTNANGSHPYGDLMQASDGMLYGMTHTEGVNNLGVLFQYNPVMSTYTKELDFSGTGQPIDGQYPQGSLMQASDGMLYGMTEQGGANGQGVLFKYSVPLPIANFKATPTSVCAGSTVQFTDTSSGSPTAWQWTFTGGTPSTSTVQNPSITYNSCYA